MIDRRALPALAGAAVAAAAGIVAAATGAPVAGAVAAAGGVAAAAGLLVVGQQAPAPDPSARAAAPTRADSVGGTTGSRVEPVTVPGAPAAPPDTTPGSSELDRDPDLDASMPFRVGPTGSEGLVDPETGLFSEDYFGVAIEARVAAARRHLRPVAVVLLEVVRGAREHAPIPCLPVEVADGIRTTLREADTACRMDDGAFALVLEDTPENGAIWTVERIRRLLVEADPSRTLWAGVACYPAHAFDSDSLLRQAQRALRAAHEWQQDRIEVAVPE